MQNPVIATSALHPVEEAPSATLRLMMNHPPLAARYDYSPQYTTAQTPVSFIRTRLHTYDAHTLGSSSVIRLSFDAPSYPHLYAELVQQLHSRHRHPRAHHRHHTLHCSTETTAATAITIAATRPLE